MKKTTRDVIRAVTADIRSAQAAIEPLLAKRSEPEFQIPEVRYVQAAQNTLRTCLEATLKAGQPYSDVICIELAIRLASYAISALPLEHQDGALQTVISSLPSAHSSRLAKGVIIQTEWETHGLRQPNVPGGRA